MHLPSCRQCLDICRAGRTLRDVHQKSVQLLSEGMASLGLFPGLNGSAIAHNTYRNIYPHSVGACLTSSYYPTSCRPLSAI